MRDDNPRVRPNNPAHEMCTAVRYGSPRVYRERVARGVRCTVNTVARTMRALGHAPRPRPGRRGGPAERNVGDGYHGHPNGRGLGVPGRGRGPTFPGDRRPGRVRHPGHGPGPAGVGRRRAPSAARPGPDRALGSGVPVAPARSTAGRRPTGGPSSATVGRGTVGITPRGRAFSPAGSRNAFTGYRSPPTKTPSVHCPSPSESLTTGFAAIPRWGMLPRQRSKPDDRDTPSTNRGEFQIGCRRRSTRRSD